MHNIRHIGIVVSNLDRMLDFYCNDIGLKVRNRQIEEGNYISAMLGYSNAKVETVKLHFDPNGPVIELLHFLSPKPASSETRNLNSLGLTHFALEVPNLDELHQKLISKGIQFVSSPAVTENNYVKVAFCQDPESNYIELVEVL